MASQDIQGTFTSTIATPPPNAPEGSLARGLNLSGEAASLLRQAFEAPKAVTLTRSSSAPTADQALWIAIRNRTEAISFNRYAEFIHRVLCEPTDQGTAVCGGSEQAGTSTIGSPSISDRINDLINRPSIYGHDAFGLLKLATQAFLLLEVGVDIVSPRDAASGQSVNDPNVELPGEEERLGRPITLGEARDALTQYLQTQIGGISDRALPYLKRVVDALIPVGSRNQGSPFCEQLLANRLSCPALTELIWNYWMEHAHLAQTMNAVMLRFQNRRRGANDPLVNLALDPLRALGHLLWGRVQDEPQQLSVSRRAHEYQYAYGLTLHGRAVADVAPVESRPKFIEAFHNLLYRAHEFYRADAVTTIVADGFPLLQALKELHLVLAESMNNQFTELNHQARTETLIDQYLLARSEMQEFLRGRVMVPYPEKWMGQVDTMVRLQGWGEGGNVTNFYHLATTGEPLLLSVRLGDWSVQLDETSARNWARYWRSHVQTYTHSYLAVTGVDLSAERIDTRRADERYVQPSYFLRRRELARPLRGTTAVGLLGHGALELDIDTPAVPQLMRPRRGV